MYHHLHLLLYVAFEVALTSWTSGNGAGYILYFLPISLFLPRRDVVNPVYRIPKLSARNILRR
jgi:hypothetical protein